ncbi:MAG: PTS system mannose/fructose/sorbose family transporter subunit IID [Elusimicrobiaceae bacterium]|nr:PTS system mannose/fructose/sorbose family transporter subunit IID [Elusimicrobiaceae bacterium]
MDINRTKYILRSLLLQGFWNSRKMQNIGLLFIMYPYLFKMYSTTPKFLRRAIQRNLETFNTNPVMVSFCLGSLMHQEQVLSNVRNNINIFYQQEKEWLIIRSSVAFTVASLGDRLFWSTLRPLSLVVAFSVLYLGQIYFLNDTMEVYHEVPTVILALVLAFISYNVPVFITRYKGFSLSYSGTEENFFGLTKLNWNKIITILKTMGQVFTLFLFIYGMYFHFAGSTIDVNIITKISILAAFIMLSVFIKKWDVPNIYLYLGSVLVFTVVALFS